MPILNGLKCQLNRLSILLIYKALVYPNITYWGSKIQTSLEKVYLVQKKIVRLEGDQGPIDHLGPFFKEHRLLTVFNTLI